MKNSEVKKPDECYRRLSRFEKTLVIGTRAGQIAKGQTPNLTLEEIGGEIDAIRIAMMEFDKGRTPFHVVRHKKERKEIVNVFTSK